MGRERYRRDQYVASLPTLEKPTGWVEKELFSGDLEILLAMQDLGEIAPKIVLNGYSGGEKLVSPLTPQMTDAVIREVLDDIERYKVTGKTNRLTEARIFWDQGAMLCALESPRAKLKKNDSLAMGIGFTDVIPQNDTADRLLFNHFVDGSGTKWQILSCWDGVSVAGGPEADVLMKNIIPGAIMKTTLERSLKGETVDETFLRSFIKQVNKELNSLVKKTHKVSGRMTGVLAFVGKEYVGVVRVGDPSFRFLFKTPGGGFKALELENNQAENWDNIITAASHLGADPGMTLEDKEFWMQLRQKQIDQTVRDGYKYKVADGVGVLGEAELDDNLIEVRMLRLPPRLPYVIQLSTDGWEEMAHILGLSDATGLGYMMLTNLLRHLKYDGGKITGENQENSATDPNLDYKLITGLSVFINMSFMHRLAPIIAWSALKLTGFPARNQVRDKLDDRAMLLYVDESRPIDLNLVKKNPSKTISRHRPITEGVDQMIEYFRKKIWKVD